MITHIKNKIKIRLKKYILWNVENYIYDKIKAFDFIAYPKTGSTWIRFMLNYYLINWFQIELDPLSIEIDMMERNVPTMPKIMWSHRDGLIASEDGTLNANMNSIFDNSAPVIKSPQCFFMVRDPRDVVVSYYHQLTKRTKGFHYNSDVDTFAKDPVYGIKRVLAFYNKYIKYNYLYKSFKIVRYEKVLDNTEEELEKLLFFLGFRFIDKQLLKECINVGAADSMRDLEKRKAINGMKAPSNDDINSLKVRKAIKHNFNNELSVNTIKELNNAIENSGDPFNYLGSSNIVHFPYED